MGIYLGDKPTALYRGSYKPVNLYSGDKKVAGWEVSEKTGTELSWDDTYNDKVLSAVVEGKSEQTVTAQGKNLFDWARAKIVDNSGIEQPSYGSINDGTYINQASFYSIGLHLTVPSGAIVGGNTYTISFEILSPVTQFIYFGVRNNAGTRTNTSKSVFANTPTYMTLTVTAPAGFTYYQNVQLQGSTSTDPRNINTVFSNIQLELGSVATPYEPFTPDSPSPDYPSPIISTGEVSGIDLTVTGNAGQSYQVHRDMVLRSLPDGTRDTWDALTGTVTRNVGIKVFDGTEGLVLDVDYSAYGLFRAQYVTTPAVGASHMGLCTHAPIISSGFVMRANVYVPTSSIFLIFPINIVGSSKSSLKEWLTAQYAAGTPVTVLYKLATPIIEQIDPAPLPTYPRYTALSCNAGVTASVRVVE